MKNYEKCRQLIYLWLIILLLLLYLLVLFYYLLTKGGIFHNIHNNIKYIILFMKNYEKCR